MINSEVRKGSLKGLLFKVICGGMVRVNQAKRSVLGEDGSWEVIGDFEHGIWIKCMVSKDHPA